jgi:hypothetical protein
LQIAESVWTPATEEDDHEVKEIRTGECLWHIMSLSILFSTSFHSVYVFTLTPLFYSGHPCMGVPLQACYLKESLELGLVDHGPSTSQFPDIRRRIKAAECQNATSPQPSDGLVRRFIISIKFPVLLLTFQCFPQMDD